MPERADPRKRRPDAFSSQTLRRDRRRLQCDAPPEPRIAARIRRALGNARTVCNIGAGTGSYEPEDLEVTAVEPSAIMIAQRTTSHAVVQASAEQLPFADRQFDAAMTVLSIHHWQDPRRGLAEMRRVSARQVVFTFDPKRIADLWLVRDYLPQIIPLEQSRAIAIDVIVQQLDAHQVLPIPIPWDCCDGFQAAYWRRPEQYLNPLVQSTISTLAQLPESIVHDALHRLEKDISSGVWRDRNRDLLTREKMDFGYRLIIAGE